MAQWIEVRACYDMKMDNGAKKRMVDSFLVEALSCTEAEAKVTEALMPFIDGEYSVTNVGKTKIAEVFREAKGDRYYKVKVNFVTLDEKTATEKKSTSYILVEAFSFKNAYDNFVACMEGTMGNYEIEQICETKIMEVFPAKQMPNG